MNLAGAMRAIPLPLKIAGIAVIALLAYGLLGRASSSLFVVVAVVLWILTVVVWIYDQGWIKPLARVPGVGRFLAFMANRAAVSGPAFPQNAKEKNASAAVSPPGRLDDQERLEIYAAGQAALASLHGNEAVLEFIYQRIVEPAAADPKNLLAANAPATILWVAGPRGIGKTSVAHAIAQLLAGVGAVETATVALVRPTDLRGGEFGSAIELAQARAKAAKDGVLLIDDAEWLLAPDPYGGQDSPGVDFGMTLVDVLRQAPGRTVVIATTSPEVLGRLKEDAAHSRWLGKLARREIVLDDLDDDALLSVLETSLAAMNWQFEDDAAASAARRLLVEMRDRKGEHFDNAEACRRAAELLVEIATDEHPESADERLIKADIVRLADEEME